MLTKATDLSITLEDRPGTLAKATDAVAKAGANIDGFCGSADGGSTFHFLFTKDGDKARKALESAGFTVKKEREVVLTEPIEDRPGAAAAEFRKIAQHELNVDLAYLATDNRIVMGGDNVQKIWESLGAESTKITA
ncbi:MAG TPA: ACT domain-containing protein [Candidatus Limnocylindria bacterium]